MNPALVALARYAILDTVFTVFLFGGLALLTVAMLRDHYVFPAAPALCLLRARAWHDLQHGNRPETGGVRWGARLVGLVLIVAGIALSFLMVERLDLPVAALAVPLALLACGLADAVGWFWARRPSAVPWIAVTAIYGGALVWVIPAFEEQKVVHDLARWVADAAEPDAARTSVWFMRGAGCP